MTKIKNILLVVIFSLVVFVGSLWLFASPDKDISVWERRRLQQMPEIKLSTLTDGSFMRNFEKYLTDQFPLRNELRSLKAKMHFNVLLQKDNGGIYISEGSASKLDVKISEASVDNFADKINELYSLYLKGTDCELYYTVVPDKNRFLAEDGGYPHYDYELMYSLVDSKLSFMEKIEIDSLLFSDSYYTTDTHWRQEKLINVADKIRTSMGLSPLGELSEKSFGDFYGVYYGQSALPLEPDKLKYLTNSEIEGCMVKNFETGKVSAVYDTEKLDALDPYDVFLSGAVSVLEVNNPKGDRQKQLVIFRDSFGSSIAPLLLQGYSKVTLIDTRYIEPEMIGDYVDFERQDVLFLYSTMMINSSSTLK